MKQGELRIGSIIQWDDDSNEIVEVKGIWFDKEINNWMVEFADGIAMLDEFIGVAITKELLVRMGFSSRIEAGHSTEYYLGINPITNDWLFSVVWHENYDFPFYKNGYFEIKYAHQLQSLLYSLTGEELKITI
jgi:hypothetical protein